MAYVLYKDLDLSLKQFWLLFLHLLKNMEWMCDFMSLAIYLMWCELEFSVLTMIFVWSLDSCPSCDPDSVLWQSLLYLQFVVGGAGFVSLFKIHHVMRVITNVWVPLKTENVPSKYITILDNCYAEYFISCQWYLITFFQ